MPHEGGRTRPNPPYRRWTVEEIELERHRSALVGLRDTYAPRSAAYEALDTAVQAVDTALAKLEERQP